jgi:trehalose 6-phosphate synthase
MREQYEQYYSIIANPVLWFIHQAWADGYVQVNVQIAQKVIELVHAAAHPALVLVHDYQLYLVPRLVREALPSAIIQHFIHVPWPTAQY